jgi:hypothetical protein
MNSPIQDMFYSFRNHSFLLEGNKIHFDDDPDKDIESTYYDFTDDIFYNSNYRSDWDPSQWYIEENHDVPVEYNNYFETCINVFLTH